MSKSEPVTGGCQCGAVRFRLEGLKRPTICHCRMCQKAFGSFFAPLVEVETSTWTRGTPKIFASSNMVDRGFCADCGTPLFYDPGTGPEFAVGALDNPNLAAPAEQVNLADKQPAFDSLHQLPVRNNWDEAESMKFMNSVVSRQHPDHDTDHWPEDGQ